MAWLRHPRAVSFLSPTTTMMMLLLSCLSGASIITDAPTQPEALALLESVPGGIQLGQDDVLLALERGWFEVSKRLLRLLRERGEAVATMAEVRGSATRIRDQATEVINLMRTGANTEATDVNCAFQWAQRPEFVYLNVKFSSRIDGPVTVLNVDNEVVSLGNNTLLFKAMGRQKPKTFKLNLTFHGAILPEASSWSFASVGRMSFTLAKVVNETWPRLLEGKAKPKNMHSWYDRQTGLNEEVKKEKEARKSAAGEIVSQPAGSSTPADPNAPPSAPPPAMPPVDVPSTGKDVKSDRSKKKKKVKAKEEL